MHFAPLHAHVHSRSPCLSLAQSPEELLPLVFELAEKHVGVPSLLEPNDLLSGDPDERAIQLYVSLFFDAFSTRKVTLLCSLRTYAAATLTFIGPSGNG